MDSRQDDSLVVLTQLRHGQSGIYPHHWIFFLFSCNLKSDTDDK